MVSRGCIGRRVNSSFGEGVLSYYGPCVLGTGDWCGVTLDEPVDGGHSGNVKGKTYFRCPPKRGILVQSRAVRLLPESSRPSRMGTRENSSSGADSDTPSRPSTAGSQSSSRMSTRAASTHGSGGSSGGAATTDTDVRRSDTPTAEPDRSTESPTRSTPGFAAPTRSSKAKALSSSSTKVKTPRSDKSTRRTHAAPTPTKHSRTATIPSGAAAAAAAASTSSGSAAAAGGRTGGDEDSLLSPPPVVMGVASIGDLSAQPSPRSKRRSLPIAGKPPSPSPAEQRRQRAEAGSSTPQRPNSGGTQRPSPKTLPAVPAGATPGAADVPLDATFRRSHQQPQQDHRLDVYRDKITMLQADLASSKAKQREIEEAARADRESAAADLKAIKRRHAETLSAIEEQLHALLAERDADVIAAEEEHERSAARVRDLEQSFTAQMQALTAASDKAVNAAQKRADNLHKECDKLRKELDAVRPQSSRTGSSKVQVDRSRKHEEELKRTVAAAAKQESAAKTLAAKVEALEAELKAVRGESEMSSREAKAAEARLAEAERVRADALEQLRQRVRDQLSDKETECAELRAEAARLRAIADQSVAQAEQLRRQMEDEHSDHTANHEQIVARYREQATAKELAFVELKDEVDALTARLARSDGLLRESKRREQDAIEALRAETEGVKSTLAADLERMRAERDAFAAESSANALKVAQLEQQAQSQRTTIAMLTSATQRSEDEQAALTARINTQNADRERLETRLRAAVADADEAHRELAKVRAAAESASRTSDRAREEAAAVSRERTQQLEAALAASTSQIQLLEAKLSAADKALAELEARERQTDSLSDEAAKWKGIADAARAELVSLEHVIELKIKENKEIRVKVLELESKLDEGRAEAAKTLSEIVRVQTQKEELVANLEAKRMAHEQAVVNNAHLKGDLKSLEEDMKALSTENQTLRLKLENYRMDLEKSGIFDPFNTPPTSTSQRDNAPSPSSRASLGGVRSRESLPGAGPPVATSSPLRPAKNTFG